MLELDSCGVHFLDLIFCGGSRAQLPSPARCFRLRSGRRCRLRPRRLAKAPVPIDFAFGARIQSDYNFRGISQSNHKPSPQAYGELQLFDNFLYFGVNYYRVDSADQAAGRDRPHRRHPPEVGDAHFRPRLHLLLLPGRAAAVRPDLQRLSSRRRTPTSSSLPRRRPGPSTTQWTVGGGVFHAWDWLGTGAPGTYVNVTAK